ISAGLTRGPGRSPVSACQSVLLERPRALGAGVDLAVWPLVAGLLLGRQGRPEMIRQVAGQRDAADRIHGHIAGQAGAVGDLTDLIIGDVGGQLAGLGDRVLGRVQARAADVGAGTDHAGSIDGQLIGSGGRLVDGDGEVTMADGAAVHDGVSCLPGNFRARAAKVVTVTTLGKVYSTS